MVPTGVPWKQENLKSQEWQHCRSSVSIYRHTYIQFIFVHSMYIWYMTWYMIYISIYDISIYDISIYDISIYDIYIYIYIYIYNDNSVKSVDVN